MNIIPHRPAISDVLVKASANSTFRAKLLRNPPDVLNEMDIPLEDVALLSDIQALNLKDYAYQVKQRLISQLA